MFQIFNTLTENIKDRVKNPFFATLIGVWLVRNWELVYSIFNFDNDCQLLDKVNFVKDFYRPKNFWNELGTNVGIAFGLMLIGYMLIIITRIIVNQVEYKIIPFLNDKASNGLAVKQTLYEQVKKERFELRNDLEIVNKKLIETEVANTNYKNENATLKIDILSKENNILSLKNENQNIIGERQLVSEQNQKLSYEIDRYSKRNEELLDRQIISEFLNRNNLSETKNIGVPKIIETFKELREQNLETEFLTVAECIYGTNLTTGIEMSRAEKYVEMNLIEIHNGYKDKRSISSKDMDLTSQGYSIFANKIILENALKKITE
ncbi:hypothetical protein [Flavobacterium sp. 5]|uniref:hypothetical protein n=1 Tax=Flavobacterium sp. 5 TaxID=2035199 RepID=UPI000C2C1F40|nr:hypothetical protein [Flavobacterium sp. 5]PKB15257.1 hypothetical protein CLU82_0321 [Flavobacterium sp. 5]